MTIDHHSGKTVSAGRPTFHFVAPRGWMNDPCAPGYDPRTGQYHLFYQWNPESHIWNNISWGHATSEDLIHWTHMSKEPVLVPDQAYDCRGVFTGCFQPSGPGGEKDQLSVLYSSVNHLPICWDQPYTRGCEGLAMATSKDGGKSWQKHTSNPILSEEPPHMHVTGFRDPFLAPWTAMDALRQSKPTLYGLISGGIHDSGPRTFLYAVDPTNLASWTYLHPLVEDIPPNFVPSEKWAGDFGANWECTGFVTLTDDRGHARECVVSGAEGGMERPWVTKYHASRPKEARRTPRYQNWFSGRLGKRDDEQVRLSVEMAGLVDWGIFYAASLLVAEDGRNMLWGWIIEEDLDEAELARKGWTGCLGLPREIFLATITGVVGALASPLESIGSVELEKGSDGSNTVITFGHRPIREFTALRGQTLFDLPPGPLQPMVSCLQSAPMAYEIQAVMGISDDTDSISFYLRHDDDMSIHTSIVFRPKDETITIDRSHSTNRQDINISPEVGSHTLFRMQHTSHPQGVLEPLRLRVFVDHDLIEVFANDRFALSTRVYTDKEARGLSLGVQGKATVEELRAWKIGELG